MSRNDLQHPGDVWQARVEAAAQQLAQEAKANREAGYPDALEVGDRYAAERVLNAAGFQSLKKRAVGAEVLLRELYEYVCKLEGAYGGQAAVRSYMKKPDELHSGIADVGKRVRETLGIEEST